MWCSTITMVRSKSSRTPRMEAMNSSTSVCDSPAAGSSSSSSRGLRQQRAAQLDALVQAVRELAGRCVRDLAQAETLEQVGASVRATFSDRAVRGSRSAQETGPPGEGGVGAEQHVLEHRLVQLQGGVLEGAGEAEASHLRGGLAADVSTPSMLIEPDEAR